MQVDVATGKDVSGKTIYVDFASGGNAAKQAQGGSSQLLVTGTRFVSRCVCAAGMAIGYSIVHIPLKRMGAGYWDEQAPQVALLTGGMGKIKLRSRGRVYYKEGGEKVPLQNGYAVKIPHLIGVDGGQVLIFDDKWLLEKITCFGRMCYDSTTDSQYFDAGAPCIFNAGGWGDCIDTPYGPRFAPSRRFGYRAQYNLEDTTEPKPGDATDRSRKWRIGDCLRYMRDLHYIGCPFTRIDYGNRTINNSFVIWPDTLIDSASASRTVNNLSCENVTLLAAMDRIIKKAGPFELYMDAGVGFTSILRVVSMNPTDSAGISLALPTYQGTADVGALVNSGEIVKAGYIDESIVNFADDVCICGDPVALEIECSMDPSANELTLEPAWSAADETAFKAYVTANGNSRLAFIAATKIWPLVYCAYRLKTGQAIWAGTKWEDMGGNLMPYSRFRAYLLSASQQNAENPRDTVSRDVVVEYHNGSSWQAAERYDFFSLSPDGQYFMLPALRDRDGDPQTWRNTGALYNGATLTKNNIRLTIPIESDWRITGVAGEKNDESDSANVSDPNQTSERVESSERFTFLAVAEAMDYIEHLRLNAHPNGVGGVGGISSAVDIFPDKASKNNELFTDRISDREGRIVEHAKARLRDVKRIEYGGQLVLANFNPALHPGDPITIAGGQGTINVLTCIKTVIHDAFVQGTIAECGAIDKSGIYDIPKNASRYSDGSLSQQPAAITSESKNKQSPGYVEDEDEIGGNKRGKFK